MSNNLVADAINALAKLDTPDLTALLQGLLPDTPVVRINKRSVDYVRTDGEVVKATPKQAKAWAKRQGTPEQRALTQARQADFVQNVIRKNADKREQKRAAQGFVPATHAQLNVRTANRAAAYDLRSQGIESGTPEFQTAWNALRTAYVNGTATPTHEALAYALRK